MAMGINGITGLNPSSDLIPTVAMAISSGVFEEKLFRGVLFLSVEMWFGTWVALVVSSLVFSLGDARKLPVAGGGSWLAASVRSCARNLSFDAGPWPAKGDEPQGSVQPNAFTVP